VRETLEAAESNPDALEKLRDKPLEQTLWPLLRDTAAGRLNPSAEDVRGMQLERELLLSTLI